MIGASVLLASLASAIVTSCVITYKRMNGGGTKFTHKPQVEKLAKQEMTSDPMMLRAVTNVLYRSCDECQEEKTIYVTQEKHVRIMNAARKWSYDVV